MTKWPTLDDVRQAEAALAGITYRTPLQESSYINDLIGTRVFFKLENLQRSGSFKLRGAYNRIRQLSSEELTRGVVAASAGNHAQGVALAAGLVGTTAVIVTPEGASLTKIEATRSYGAEVRQVGESFDDAFREAERMAQQTGRVLVHAFDDPLIIAGQGTIGLEMLDERATLDTLVVPVGGGGLIAGIALAAKARYPRIKVIGVQAVGAPAMVDSVREGRLLPAQSVRTIADGIAVKRPGDLTFAMIQHYVDELVTVDEHDISRAILIFLERSKLLVEGAGAVGLAALLAGKIPVGNQTIATVVSGGNIDVTLLSRIIEKGLVEESRQLHLATVIPDRPGQLSRLLDLVASLKANVIRVSHERWDPSIAPVDVSVRLVVETRNAGHRQEILEALTQHGYQVSVEREAPKFP
ncbi:threonine ammonia-lyase [Sulfobacillus harzensis]|uniref:L-threonine dehydratase catabolic TdcB n=1 Tax=Sulfobacillus harzensis TaxID=2729629 RepID=A0A7Y0L5J2_9FIRM|nr:threonine ammonia-lyase [Sulfobacillus harzensis]NMP23362.1 threonine ammonia-lyase [Sulfobacillus harzensis]